MEKIADLIKQVVVHAVETTMQQSQGLAAVAPCGPEAAPPLGAAAGCSWAGPRI